MVWQRDTFKKIKQIPQEEYVLPGAGLCAGCGGLEALRLASKVLGDNVVYVNAAGCLPRSPSIRSPRSTPPGSIRQWGPPQPGRKECEMRSMC